MICKIDNSELPPDRAVGTFSPTACVEVPSVLRTSVAPVHPHAAFVSSLAECRKGPYVKPLCNVEGFNSQAKVQSPEKRIKRAVAVPLPILYATHGNTCPGCVYWRGLCQLHPVDDCQPKCFGCQLHILADTYISHLMHF